MTLRRQLLAVSLLLLSLPWAGCQFVREMESALRHGQEQSVQATAQAIAAVVGARDELLYPNPLRRTAPADNRAAVYAYPIDQPLIVDGYGDGWEEIGGASFSSGPGARPLAVKYRAASRNGILYLLLQVEDPEVIFHNPGLSNEPNGDRLVLRTWRNDRRQEYVIATAAPGQVRATMNGPLQAGLEAGQIRGYWQDAAGGYSLELEIPLAYTGGRLGFYLVNAGRRAGGRFETLGNIEPLETTAPPWLIYSPDELQQALAPFGRQGNQILVVDRQQWLIADIPPASPKRQDTAETFWLLRLVYRSILSTDGLLPLPTASGVGQVAGEEIAAALRGEASNQRYRDPQYGSRTNLSAAAPILHEGTVIGAVVARQSGEEYLSLTDRAFSRLLGYSLLGLFIGAFGLLAYASLLSWRIGSLSKAARNALQEEMPGLQNFPRSRARDEIGELSRHYADLLDQLREYNDYLRTLSRKLSHELRTPIAVIQSSLDNLEQATPATADTAVYVTRAREGLLRLNSILTAMSEANRLEESIRGNTPQPTDLAALLREVAAAYRDIYPQYNLELHAQAAAAPAMAAPELLVQALDKLVDNAASFCPPGGIIGLRLMAVDARWEISVSNDGPTLPAELRERLFEPMVSLRESSSAVHLGLGLHIVKLIVDFHRGAVRAENLPDGNGVCVTISLPTIRAESQTSIQQSPLS